MAYESEFAGNLEGTLTQLQRWVGDRGRVIGSSRPPLLCLHSSALSGGPSVAIEQKGWPLGRTGMHSEEALLTPTLHDGLQDLSLLASPSLVECHFQSALTWNQIRKGIHGHAADSEPGQHTVGKSEIILWY